MSPKTDGNTAVSIVPTDESHLKHDTPNSSEVEDSAFPTLETLSQDLWQIEGEEAETGLGDEPTDSYAIFPSDEDSSATETDSPYGPRESLLVSDDPCQWLMVINSCTEACELVFEDASSETTIRALVVDGRICAGMSSDGAPYLDADFRAEAPELAESYLHYCQDRSGHPQASHAPALVDRDEFELTDAQEQVFARQTLRMFQRTKGQIITRRRVDLDEIEVSNPVSYSPVEMVVAVRREERGGPSAMLDMLHNEFTVEPDASWLFETRGEDSASCSCWLLDTDAPAMRTLNDLFEAVGRADEMMAVASCLASEDGGMGYTMGFDGDRLWLCVACGEHVVIQNHASKHAGRVIAELEGMCSDNLTAETTL